MQLDFSLSTFLDDIFLITLWQSNDVTFADGALLKVDQPLLKAVYMKNVLAHRNFHQLFSLLKVLETQPALPLIHHVRIVNSIFYVL